MAPNLDADGNPVETLVDGVDTLITRDADERVITQTFQAYPSLYSYGGLTYQYDPDGHVIDKGGSLAAVNLPPAATASYSTTDQVLIWNTHGSMTDHASNITYDPASGLSLTWTARNQVASITTTSEAYDGLGRRESAGGLNFEHDGSTLIGWTVPFFGSYNFLTLPGGGAVAGSDTTSGNQITWVPLIDASGSTIALVNAASTGSPPATTYTYDPSGNPTVSGTMNYWPFLYRSLEKEVADPGPYYYSGAGQFYSPQLVRSLSEVGQTSSSGPGGGPSGNSIAGPSGGGPSGNSIAGPSGGGFSPNFSPSLQESGEALGVGAGAAGATAGAIAAYNAFLAGAEGASGGYATPVVVVGLVAEGLFELFDNLFGGGSDNPPTPRQLLHGRHPLYPVILGIQNGLIPSEASAGPKICGDPQICLTRPLADDKVLEIPQATTPATPRPGPYISTEEATTLASYLIEHRVPRAEIYSDLIAAHVEPNEAALLAFGPNPGTPIPLETPSP